MHLLMSYCGSIATLMADTGIVEILSVAFGGVFKMLSGKTFPQNVRALRMLVEELLRPLFGKKIFHNMDDLLQELDAISVKSKTSQLWVESLIKPIFVILKYIRAEREADWTLLKRYSLSSLVQVIPIMPDTPCTTCELWKVFQLKSANTSWQENTQCITPQVCSTAYGLIWPLKLSSCDMDMGAEE